MSRFNFLNPTQPPEPAVSFTTATVAKAIKAARKPRPDEDSITVIGTTPDGHELRANASKQGVEIRFFSKPPGDVLDVLKQAGWKWSRFSGVWYARDSAAAREWARNFLATLDGAPAATPQPAPTTVPAAEIKSPATVAPAPSTLVLRETKAVVIMPPVAPMKGMMPFGLPTRPKPFAKPA